MKTRTYIQPEIELISLSSTQIIAASIIGNSVYGDTEASSNCETLSKPQYFVLDDEEDEWENEW